MKIFKEHFYERSIEMRYFLGKKLSLLAIMLVMVFWGQECLLRDNADDAEEELLTKILEKRAKKRYLAGESDDNTSSPDLRLLKTDDKQEISLNVVNDIKNIVKEPCLTFLASSELVSWPDLAKRFTALKKGIELFEVKYKTELSSDGRLVPSAVQVGFPAMNNVSNVVSGLKPIGMITAPTLGNAVMPGVAQKKEDEEDEDEDDEEEDDNSAVQKNVNKPGALLLTQPSIIPVQQMPLVPQQTMNSVSLQSTAQSMPMPQQNIAPMGVNQASANGLLNQKQQISSMPLAR